MLSVCCFLTIVSIIYNVCCGFSINFVNIMDLYTTIIQVWGLNSHTIRFHQPFYLDFVSCCGHHYSERTVEHGIFYSFFILFYTFSLRDEDAFLNMQTDIYRTDCQWHNYPSKLKLIGCKQYYASVLLSIREKPL